MTLNNYGTMTSINVSGVGAQALDFNAIVSGSNIINNCSTGIMQATEADGVDVDGLVNITNTGTIKSLNSLNDTSEGNNHWRRHY